MVRATRSRTASRDMVRVHEVVCVKVIAGRIENVIESTRGPRHGGVPR